MKTSEEEKVPYCSPGILKKSWPRLPLFAELENSLHATLENYANVHRGTGHRSQVSTALYEQARRIVRQYMNCTPKNEVIFCSPFRLVQLRRHFGNTTQLRVLKSRMLGLPVGLCAVVVPKKLLGKKNPALPGGGTVKLVSKTAVVWADGAERFEAGTPNILGAIAMARALQLKADARFVDLMQWNSDVLTETPKQVAHRILFEDAWGDLRGDALLSVLKTTLINDLTPVPSARGSSRFINFDYGASTPTFGPVWNAVRDAWLLDTPGKTAIVDAVRKRTLDYFGAGSGQWDLHFASNTTEAIHIASMGYLPFSSDDEDTVIVNTELEHNSNELIWRTKQQTSLVRMPADADGFVSLEALERLMTAYNREYRFGKKRIRLVCITGASNVMGSSQDIQALSRIVHRFGAHLLVDAAQAAAHRTLSMENDTIDFLAFSGHKMYAPFGSGGLIAKKGLLRFSPKTRALVTTSGEENIAGIAALGKAIDLLERIGLDRVREREQRVTRYALSKLATVSGLNILGIRSGNHPRIKDKGGVICFDMDGISHNLLAKCLAEQAGIAVRSGCFCVNLYVKKQLGIGPVKNGIAHAGLALMPALTQKLLTGVVRVSLGICSEERDIDILVETLQTIAERPQGRLQRWLAKERFGTPFLPETDTTKRIDRFVKDVTERVFCPAAE